MKQFSKILLCFLHGLFLTLLTIFIAQSDIVHWDDEELVWVNQFVKKQILKIESKPEDSEFIFINVSFDNLLVDKYDENGFLLGNQDITDRKKLAYFLSSIRKANNHKVAFCDIRFIHPSPYDSLLAPQLQHTPRLICSTHKGLDSLQLFKSNYAYSDYANDGSFLKFRYLSKEGKKTTPVRLFEELHQSPIKKSFGLIKVDNNYLLNNSILDMRIREFDYKANKSVSDSSNYHIKYVQLGDLIKLDTLLGQTFIQEQVKDRIIVLGDFEDRDLHSTVSGNLAGPVLIINAYLALKNSDNEITFFFLFFLTICFFIISLFIFFDLGKSFSQSISNSRFFSRFQFIIELVGYFLVLFLLSLFCYIWFEVQISIIIIAVYIKLVSWLRQNVIKSNTK